MSAQIDGGDFHLCIQTMISHSCASVLFMRCHTTARLTILDAAKCLQITGYLANKFKAAIKLFYWWFSLWSQAFVFITTGPVWDGKWPFTAAAVTMELEWEQCLSILSCNFLPLRYLLLRDPPKEITCKITPYLKCPVEDMALSVLGHSSYCSKHTNQKCWTWMCTLTTRVSQVQVNVTNPGLSSCIISQLLKGQWRNG